MALSVGIDLGADTAKLICLLSSKTGYKLMAHALVRRAHFQSLKEFLNYPEIKQAEIRIAIQDPKIRIQKLTIPIVPREEIDHVVTWAFREATSIPVDDFVIRFLEARMQSDPQKQNVLAFAMEKSHIAQWLKFVAEAGITNPQVAEPDIQSLTNAVAYNYELKEDDRYAIIDIGKTQSQLAVVSHEGIEFYRPFSGIGGDPLASNLSHELNISIEEAERFSLEIANNIVCDQQDQVIDIVSRYCAKFCVQAQYAIENYLAQAKDRPITNILLSGGGAKLKGLKDQIQDTLHFPTDLIDPFSRFDLGRFNKNDFENFKTLYAVAAGLAL